MSDTNEAARSSANAKKFKRAFAIGCRKKFKIPTTLQQRMADDLLTEFEYKDNFHAPQMVDICDVANFICNWKDVPS